MAERESATTIIGLFRSQEEAERAINLLVQAGFPSDNIGFLAPGQAQEPDYQKSTVAGVGGGAAIGAIAGGLLGVASMVVAPGIGPIVTAGAWLPPLVGVATGASLGGTAGGLFSLAATGDQALHYRQQVQEGRALVNVSTDQPEQAIGVLEQAGALEVADVGKSETAETVDEPEQKTE